MCLLTRYSNTESPAKGLLNALVASSRGEFTTDITTEITENTKSHGKTVLNPSAKASGNSTEFTESTVDDWLECNFFCVFCWFLYFRVFCGDFRGDVCVGITI